MGKFSESITLSLGGSLIVPDGGIDTDFLTDFNKFIRRQIEKNGRRFFIITGGGSVTRNYQKAAKTVLSTVPDEDLDWLGIHSTRLNAHLIRTIFRDIARPKIIEHYDKKEDVGGYPLVLGGGWKPGWSTDYDAVYICNNYGAKKVINLSNIKKVYDKDPNKYPDAKPIDKISWKEFRSMFGDKWSPGLSTPFDLMASKLADQLGMKVIVLDGRNLANVETAIDGKAYEGTTIE